ncbi:TyeA family type III secretion system gatekeeper subunit [Endozoicomonas arenosclerae]|uniref:TyeA family type III secretion system gatekeeper subunit n=1 Tax=Endozoicomonas arenosclerae TaxID=1633495 RepID=UPI000781A195|nr:TyeA family type III secretion system gatekeeper subunit [Endozoicomonas arenosclerae]
MTIPLDRAGGASPPSFLESNQNIAGNQGAKGKVAGQAVQVKSDSTSALLDSAEELSMVADRFKQTKLKDRKLSTGSELSDKLLERIKKIQAIQETQAFKDLVNNFVNQPNLNLNQVLKQAQEFSDDVLEQFAALDFAAEYFEELGDEEKANQIRTAQQRIREKNLTLIQAGLNISESAAQMIEEMGFDVDVRTVRENYAGHLDSMGKMDHVRDDGSLKKTYRYLVETYGAENLENAIQGQLDLLATDLNSVTQSTSPVRLKVIIDDMKGLKIQSGVHDACCEAEDRVERTFPDENVVRFVLMEGMLDLVDQQWVTETDFDQLPLKMNLERLEAQIFALTSIVDIVRSIPEEVFTNDETKLNMLSAATDSLDSKIEDEESEIIEEAAMDAELGEGFIGELTESLDLPADKVAPTPFTTVNSSEETQPKPSTTVNSSEVTQSESPQPLKGSADYIIEKFMGRLPDDTYGDLSDAFNDVRALSGNKPELEKLLSEIPKLKSIDPSLSEFADRAEEFIKPLLAPVDGIPGMSGDDRQGVQVKGG